MCPQNPQFPVEGDIEHKVKVKKTRFEEKISQIAMSKQNFRKIKSEPEINACAQNFFPSNQNGESQILKNFLKVFFKPETEVSSQNLQMSKLTSNTKWRWKRRDLKRKEEKQHHFKKQKKN